MIMNPVIQGGGELSIETVQVTFSRNSPFTGDSEASVIYTDPETLIAKRSKVPANKGEESVTLAIIKDDFFVPFATNDYKLLSGTAEVIQFGSTQIGYIVHSDCKFEEL